MSKQIEELVLNCEACRQYQRTNNKEIYIRRDIPQGPWQVLDIDLHYLYYYKDWIYIIIKVVIIY